MENIFMIIVGIFIFISQLNIKTSSFLSKLILFISGLMVGEGITFLFVHCIIDEIK